MIKNRNDHFLAWFFCYCATLTDKQHIDEVWILWLGIDLLMWYVCLCIYYLFGLLHCLKSIFLVHLLFSVMSATVTNPLSLICLDSQAFMYPVSACFVFFGCWQIDFYDVCLWQVETWAFGLGTSQAFSPKYMYDPPLNMRVFISRASYSPCYEWKWTVYNKNKITLSLTNCAC